MSLTYNQAVEQTITAGEQIHQIVNGTATTEVTVEDGSKVPSIRKALLDNFYFKDPITWQVGQTENVFNQLRQFTDGSWWYAPSATASNPISMGSTPVGDSLWKIYDFDAIGKLEPRIDEALRRSYAEAGYNVVGTFQAGFTYVNANDVGIDETTGKGFTGPAGPVAAGTDPASGGFVDRSAALLRLNLGITFAESYGFSQTNTAAQNGAIINSLIAMSDVSQIWFSFPAPMEGVIVNRPIKLQAIGRMQFDIQTDGAFGIKLIKGSVGSVIVGVSPKVTANNQTKIIIDGREGSGSNPQYNRLYDILTEGGKSETETHDGSVSLLLADTWSNSFYGCYFNRTQTGVVFGYPGAAANSVNANHFYGCELRSVNTYTNGGKAILHYGGDANAWIGGAIENWKQEIEVHGGLLVITAGAYIEAFASASTISMYGGSAKVTECFLNSPFVFLYGPSNLCYKNNTIRTALSNKDYPIIQHRADVECRLDISGNTPRDGEGSPYMIRSGVWRNSGVWQKLSSYLKSINFKQQESIVVADLVTSVTNVTGDGTEFILFQPSDSVALDELGEFSSGILNAKYEGIYTVRGAVTLTGIAADCDVLIYLRTATGDPSPTLNRSRVLATQTVSGVITLPFSASVPIDDDAQARIAVTVSGTTKTIGIRGRTGAGSVSRNTHAIIKREK